MQYQQCLIRQNRQQPQTQQKKWNNSASALQYNQCTSIIIIIMIMMIMIIIAFIMTIAISFIMIIIIEITINSIIIMMIRRPATDTCN